MGKDDIWEFASDIVVSLPCLYRGLLMPFLELNSDIQAVERLRLEPPLTLSLTSGTNNLPSAPAFKMFFSWRRREFEWADADEEAGRELGKMFMRESDSLEKDRGGHLE